MLVPDARLVSIDLLIARDLLRSRVALEAESLVLRQQINVLRRANPRRLRFVSIDQISGAEERAFLAHLRHVLLSYMDYFNGTRTWFAVGTSVDVLSAIFRNSINSSG
jgi:hypothetical protein